MPFQNNVCQSVKGIETKKFKSFKKPSCNKNDKILQKKMFGKKIKKPHKLSQDNSILPKVEPRKSMSLRKTYKRLKSKKGRIASINNLSTIDYVDKEKHI